MASESDEAADAGKGRRLLPFPATTVRYPTVASLRSPPPHRWKSHRRLPSWKRHIQRFGLERTISDRAFSKPAALRERSSSVGDDLHMMLGSLIPKGRDVTFLMQSQV